MEKQLPQDIIRKSKKCKYGKKASTYREFKKKEKKKKSKLILYNYLKYLS